MKGTVRIAAIGFLLAGIAAAADAPKLKTLSDAEIYVKARMAELEKAKAEAIAKARADIERRTALSWQAKLAVLRRQLIEERAKVAQLTAKVEDLTNILKTRQATAAIAPTPKEWGRPVFADDFSRQDVSDKWDKEGLKPGPNCYKVVDGMLTGKEKIDSLPRFSGKAIRVEYDTWTMAENPCDASVYLANPEKDFSVFAGIGGEMNRVCKLVAGDKALARKGVSPIIRGRRQHMIVECGRGVMRVEVDGKMVIEHKGVDVPAAFENVHLALYSWTPGMHFDNVKVFVIK